MRRVRYRVLTEVCEFSNDCKRLLLNSLPAHRRGEAFLQAGKFITAVPAILAFGLCHHLRSGGAGYQSPYGGMDNGMYGVAATSCAASNGHHQADRRHHHHTHHQHADVPPQWYGSDEFGHDSPSRYASPKGAGAGAPYQEPYYGGGGEWAANYYQPPPPYQHDPYATSPGVAAAAAGGGAEAGGAELPLPPMSSFRAAAPLHSPTDPMLLGKPTLQPVSTHCRMQGPGLETGFKNTGK
ncbi:hypothetical protein evm_012669 [Chilo suppressalis]|nr:hypothetical protein evm_012669 [Chilo suppressalis]